LEGKVEEEKVVRLNTEKLVETAYEMLRELPEAEQRKGCDAFEKRNTPGLAQQLRLKLGLIKPPAPAPFRRRVFGTAVVAPREQEDPDIGVGRVRLNLNAPYDMSKIFVREARDGARRRYAFIGRVDRELIRAPMLWHWKGDWKCWNGKHYEDVEDDRIKAQVYEFMDGAITLDGVKVSPRQKTVNELIDALKAGTNLDAEEAPCWIKVPREAKGLLVCRNGLLELETGRLWNHDPRFFGLNCVDFDFNPKARAPRWERFLEEVWPGDVDAQATLQEFFGLWLTDETKYQKALALIGKTRSGKGTIGRLLKGLLGNTSFIAVSLQTLGEDFGMQGLIGKKLALVPDVKLDRRANITRIMERLLTTVGEDDQSINRKNKDYWNGKLNIRWLILGNDIPQFRGTDENGALAARMVMLQMNESFFGREDFDLTTKLLAERAGILNWSMEGWRRLRSRGKFIQPVSGLDLLAQLRAATSTIGTFVLECCELGYEYRVEHDALWLAFCEWCEHSKIGVTWSKNTFSGALHDVFPDIVTYRPRDISRPERPRWQYGIKLKYNWRSW
jgi:putative DNA primase/helicase